MFSLIITIISIALVAALAIATIYYGGTAFTQGKSKAETAKLLNEASQIQAASKLYQTDQMQMPSSIADLTAGSYLRAEIQGWTIPSAGSPAEITISNLTACEEFNLKYVGNPTPPACGSVTNPSQPVCCVN